MTLAQRRASSRIRMGWQTGVLTRGVPATRAGRPARDPRMHVCSRSCRISGIVHKPCYRQLPCRNYKQTGSLWPGACGCIHAILRDLFVVLLCVAVLGSRFFCFFCVFPGCVLHGEISLKLRIYPEAWHRQLRARKAGPPQNHEKLITCYTNPSGLQPAQVTDQTPSDCSFRMLRFFCTECVGVHAYAHARYRSRTPSRNNCQPRQAWHTGPQARPGKLTGTWCTIPRLASI